MRDTTAGFQIVEHGQYGNPKYENAVLQGAWPDYRGMGSTGRRNIQSNPDQVWILARKPLLSKIAKGE